MKKTILTFIIILSCLFSNDKTTINNDRTIYPELIGLGGLPSINLEQQTKNNYILRYGIGMIVGQAITFPLAIYKIDSSKKNKREKGIGLFIVPFDEIGIVGIYNWRFEPSKKLFIRIGWIGGISLNMYPIMLPTLGFGIKL